MKIYVDETPKDCWDCPMHDGENGWCKMLVCYTDYVPKDCPLQSVTDYTKQVREEVVDEIKNELAELKQKAIVPKFKIGQEVWFVSDPYTARYAKVRHMKIEEISISSIFVERGVMYAGDDWAGISESELFATKEEAEQKLAEIGGEKNE